MHIDAYQQISNLLLEKEYTSARQKRTRNVLLKYRNRFVDRLEPDIKIAHAGHRTGLLIRMMNLYKKYNGNIPVHEKIRLERDFKLKSSEIPNPNQSYESAKNGYSRWSRYANEAQKEAEEAYRRSRTQYTADNIKRAKYYADQAKKARRMRIIFYSLIIGLAMWAESSAKKREEKARKARQRARHRAKEQKKK